MEPKNYPIRQKGKSSFLGYHVNLPVCKNMEKHIYPIGSRIHGTGILIEMVNVLKYTSPMDPTFKWAIYNDQTAASSAENGPYKFLFPLFKFGSQVS